MSRHPLSPIGLILLFALGGCAKAEEKILYEKPSKYNHIMVTEDEEGLRTLMFEHGGARQSVIKPGDPDHIELQYAQAAMVGLALVEEPRRILVVGLGGGTIPSFLHKHYPQARIDAVELDPAVIEVAKRFFDFREDRNLRAVAADGRKFIEECRDPYDLIFLDAFGPDSIPYSLTTREFLVAVRRALAPGGVVLGNVWSIESNPLYDSMVRTYQDVFAELYLQDVPERGNRIFVGLPVARHINRDVLVKRAAALSRQKHFRFDLGEIVRRGFREETETGSARVLRDKDQMKKAG